MSKIMVSSTACFLNKWTNLTNDNLELQWPLWGTCDLLKLVLFQTKLEDDGNKTEQSEWDSYFNWHLEASKYMWDSKWPLYKGLFLS